MNNIIAELSGSQWEDIVIVGAILIGYIVFRLTGGHKDKRKKDDEH